MRHCPKNGACIVEHEKLLRLATELGCALLKNGAEIYRVEESVERVLTAYSVDDPQVFAIPTLLIVTLVDGEGRPHTQIKHLKSPGVNLSRIDELNDLCRSICQKKPSPEQALLEVSRLEQNPVYSESTQVFAFAITSFFFTLFFNGTMADALCAALCGVVIRISIHFMNRFETNTFFRNILASAILAAIAMATVHLGWGNNSDKIIIGALMTLVPGVMITNCMRDVMAGDLVASLVRLVEALLIGTAIALGAGMAITAARMIWGV